MTVGTASAIDGDNGSTFCCFWIKSTIFSRRNELICFSRPLLTAFTDPALCNGSDLKVTGAVREDGSNWSTSSDEAESTLTDSSGMSAVRGLELERLISGVVVERGCGSQQNVSRFHILQLRFSSRRPSSIDSAHFEKTAEKPSVIGARGWWRLKDSYHSTYYAGSPHFSGRRRAFWPHPPLASASPFSKA